MQPLSYWHKKFATLPIMKFMSVESVMKFVKQKWSKPTLFKRRHKWYAASGKNWRRCLNLFFNGRIPAISAKKKQGVFHFCTFGKKWRTSSKCRKMTSKWTSSANDVAVKNKSLCALNFFYVKLENCDRAENGKHVTYQTSLRDDILLCRAIKTCSTNNNQTCTFLAFFFKGAL